MEKTIMLGDKELRLSNNIGWAITFRDQFGRDIIPVLMPGLRGGMNIVAGIMEEAEDLNHVTSSDMARILESESMTEAMIYLSGLEFVDFLNITWAMAKEVDPDIPEPHAWIKQFDEFPMEILGPAVLELLIRGVSSSKNWERLQKMMADLKEEAARKLKPRKKTTKKKSTSTR